MINNLAANYEDEFEEDQGIFLTDPQTDFTKSKDKYPLFLAGFGSGKSTCMCVNILNDMSYPNTNVAAYAPTYDLISLITAPMLEEMLASHEIPYKYNKQRNIIDLEGHGNIIMRSLDNPARVVGYEVFRSHVDELDTIEKKKAGQLWNKIIARNRQKVYMRGPDGFKIKIGDGPGGRPIFKAYTNRVSGYTTPEGFMFCYDRWEKNPKPGYKIYRASTYSNAHNLPEDYIDSLKSSYPAVLVDAYIHGYFVNLTGGACYPNFSRTKNHTDAIVEDKEELHVGMDFNVMRGAASIHVVRDNIVYAVDEISKAYDTDEQITYLKENYPDHYIKVYPDAAGNHRTASNTVETDIVKLEAAGFEVIYDPSNPAIKDRVFSVQGMICNAKGERRYFVNTEMCPDLTDALEQQIWGDNGLPDKKAGLDHITDSVGYFIWQAFPIVKPTQIVTHARGMY